MQARQTASPGTRAMDVQRLIDDHPLSAWQWVVFALCFFVVLLDGFDTAAIGYIAPSLIKDWGVTKPMLGPVLSAALFGLAAGALCAGPVADRLGRKRVLTAAVLVFGLASLASSFATDLSQLSTLRFITGLGLGAAMPNAVTLMSEYCPSARRSTLTNLMFCGFPLGAAFGGFLAAWMIPQWGWQSVLQLGGAVPLLLTVALLALLPESVRFMVTRHQPVERIRAALARIAGPRVNDVDRFTLSETRVVTNERGGLAQVLARPYRLGTLMLWLAYFMGLVIFYALINWMPLLFKEAGIEPKTATLIAALFPLGGVGAVAFGWLMDRIEPNRLLAIGFALTAVAVWSIGQLVGQVGGLVVGVFVAGALMNTAQSSLPALAASFYPTNGRATGVAWMLGIGRFGGIAGSFLVAQLSAMHAGIATVFAVVAIPGLIAAAALWIKRDADRFTDRSEARGVPAH
ncbi:MFS transporter [Roseateles saccharophilus]|uniref:AAHS family 4-hydroxybenzoate transporter-like MFS transporter n=1 Tax=Roseateles saccharophilus TaxID=304 RepID=A0A4R3UXF4_ROSSA|nr:aromatic acid/H+ symport family MFS transporter [Roseateles saccharophilus]MDG0832726.1 MFS transporter [Roseateles saccharophilus]TCU95338.1 AAHS family 4-hydroxybenzoate transporter-like MFS transporter [Roseateles saccharophilus]